MKLVMTSIIGCIALIFSFSSLAQSSVSKNLDERLRDLAAQLFPSQGEARVSPQKIALLAQICRVEALLRPEFNKHKLMDEQIVSRLTKPESQHILSARAVTVATFLSKFSC